METDNNDATEVDQDLEPKAEEGDAVETDQPETLTADGVKELIKDAVNETNKTWQSRFDKLREEKEKESKAKETVEQRIARIEKERQDERLAYAREKAIAKSGVEEEFFAYAEQIGSEKIESIESGISGLVDWLNKRIEKAKAEIYDEAYKDKYAKPGGTPKQGKAPDLEAQLKAAREAGNMAKVIELTRQIQG